MSSNTTTNWTKEEFLTYLLIYTMEADFEEAPSEITFIKEKVGEATYEKMKAEWEADSDYDRACKIQDTYQRLSITREKILEELMDLSKADEKVDTLERNLMVGLKRLLQ